MRGEKNSLKFQENGVNDEFSERGDQDASVAQEDAGKTLPEKAEGG